MSGARQLDYKAVGLQSKNHWNDKKMNSLGTVGCMAKKLKKLGSLWTYMKSMHGWGGMHQYKDEN